MEGVLNGSLDLEWMFTDIPTNQRVLRALLYFNETNFDIPNDQNIICTWDLAQQKPIVTKGEVLFPGRIFATYEPDVYKLTLTNLQYNDTGSFYLRVAVGTDPIAPSATDRAIIRISKINGEYGFLFISSVLVSGNEISEVIIKNIIHM